MRQRTPIKSKRDMKSKNRRNNKPQREEKNRIVSGKLSVSHRGFAFLRPDDGSEDIFILKKNLHGAWHKDKVTVAWHKSNGAQGGNVQKREGSVSSIVERANATLLGTVYKEKNIYYFTPLDAKIKHIIMIPARMKNGAKNGQRVTAEIIQWPKAAGPAIAKVTEVLGDLDTPGLDMLEVIAKYDLSQEFPPEVLAEAEQKARLAAGDDTQRLDLRGDVLVTIDGLDARDLDDAVSLQVLPAGGFHLGVHIADVGQYVPVGGRLDMEAFERGTSVYLPDRVLPMLPKQLSNGICSLNAGEDRLALSCLMDLDATGQVTAYRLAESVIRVQKRLDYESVNKALEDKDPAQCEAYGPLLPVLEDMEKLAALLRGRRLARGAVDFNFPETKVVMDADGKVADIVKRERHTAEGMIEEFMIIANEVVATHYYGKKTPFIYRVHEQPDLAKCMTLNQMLAPFSYALPIKGGKVTPQDFVALLQKAAGKPEEKLVQTLALRSMQHAAYSTLALGHFGLSSAYYSHFTSPIRRYPDLAIHRVIKADLRGNRLDEEQKEKLLERMQSYATQSSKREIVAEEAEREAVAAKVCEYMQERIGQHFTATIASVTAYGFYVALDNTAEGLVHVSKLEDDDYVFDEGKLVLKGIRHGNMYQIGQMVEVVLYHVDKEQRLIDFILAEHKDS